MTAKPWNKKEVKKIRETLESRLERLVSSAQDTVPDLKSTNPGAMADPGDMAAHEFEQGFGVRLKERERRLIKKIRQAIERIDNDEYGICEECEDYIDLPRLQARPVTTLCIDCKEDQEFLEKLEMHRS